MAKEAYLDTHLVIWLYSGNLDLISQKAKDTIETHELFHSPIIKGEVIEDYPEDRPFASCLMLGWAEGKPFHVVVSLDEKEDMAYIITVYEPSLDKFEPDYKTRRK